MDQSSKKDTICFTWIASLIGYVQLITNELESPHLMLQMIQTPIPKPPFEKLGKKLESAMRKGFFDFNLLDNCSSLAIALSGGKDSLALLFLLKAALGRGLPNIPLHAIHISGDVSCGASMQESYIQSVCKALDVPLTIVPSTIPREKLECYSCSRMRRKLLFDTAKSHGIHHIAFGHHMDDMSETLFMNLMHKGEFEGMHPKVKMEAYDVTIIRPLIYIEESDIISFAEKHGFRRITCQCPVGINSKRRKAKELIDQIQDHFPNAMKNLALAAREHGTKKALKP